MDLSFWRTCKATARQVNVGLVLDVRKLSDEDALNCVLVHIKIVSLAIKELEREESLVQLIRECACMERTREVYIYVMWQAN